MVFNWVKRLFCVFLGFGVTTNFLQFYQKQMVAKWTCFSSILMVCIHCLPPLGLLRTLPSTKCIIKVPGNYAKRGYYKSCP